MLHHLRLGCEPQARRNRRAIKDDELTLEKDVAVNSEANPFIVLQTAIAT